MREYLLQLLETSGGELSIGAIVLRLAFGGNWRVYLPILSSIPQREYLQRQIQCIPLSP